MAELAEKTCKNCMHTRCLFHGEDRVPVYTVRVNCWDNAFEALSATTQPEDAA